MILLRLNFRGAGAGSRYRYVELRSTCISYMRASVKALCNSPLTRTCGTWNAIGLIEQWAWLPGDRSVHYPALCPSLLDRAAAGQQLLTSKQDATANLLNAHANLAGSTIMTGIPFVTRFSLQAACTSTRNLPSRVVRSPTEQ